MCLGQFCIGGLWGVGGPVPPASAAAASGRLLPVPRVGIHDLRESPTIEVAAAAMAPRLAQRPGGRINPGSPDPPQGYAGPDRPLAPPRLHSGRRPSWASPDRQRVIRLTALSRHCIGLAALRAATPIAVLTIALCWCSSGELPMLMPLLTAVDEQLEDLQEVAGLHVTARNDRLGSVDVGLSAGKKAPVLASLLVGCAFGQLLSLALAVALVYLYTHLK